MRIGRHSETEYPYPADPGSEQEQERKLFRLLRRHRRRRVKAVAVLPSLFTLGNLLSGFAAIHFASKPIEPEFGLAFGGGWWSSIAVAGGLVFFGMSLDAVDGYVARLTRSTSEIGAQLDSLADVVTFGVAPAYMTLQLVSQYYLANPDAAAVINPIRDDLFGRLFWAIAAIYVACTALRLARFNVETLSADVVDHMVFRGLPSPGAAGTLASLILFHQHYIAPATYDWAARVTGISMAFIMLLCALAMVSRLPYVHVINRYVRGNARFGYVVYLAILLIFFFFYPTLALAIGFTLYALSAPVRALLRIRPRLRARRRLAMAAIRSRDQQRSGESPRQSESEALRAADDGRAARRS